jgi:hypothetical protein
MKSRSLFVAVMCVSVFTSSGCGKGSQKNPVIDGVQGPNVNFVDNKLTMSVVLKDLQIDYGVRIPIPHMPASYLEVGPDLQSNGYMINFGVDAGDLKNIAGPSQLAEIHTELHGKLPLL